MTPLTPLPEVVVEADGSPLPEAGLETVRVVHRMGLPAQCELTFRGQADPALEPGAGLRVLVGPAAEPLFVGDVTAVEHVYEPDGGRLVRVRGYDPLHRLRASQPVRALAAVSAGSLAEELAAELGLSTETTDAGPVWPILIQHRQSNLDLLTEVAARCGRYPVVDGDVLRLVGLAGSGDPLPLDLGGSLLEARIDVNRGLRWRGVRASGWDTARAEPHRGTAGDLDGDRVRELAGEAVPDDLHAEALAQAELDQRTAAEVTLWGIAEGDARLRPGRLVRVEGVDVPLTGTLTEVIHTVDGRAGFVSEITSAPPEAPPRPPTPVTTFATVSAIDDPEGLGRVRVTLPAYGDVETGWLEVVSAGAGAGKGLVTLADVGDTVLVLFGDGDPGRGVVLGGVYGPGGPPDAGISGGAVRRYTLLTPAGQRVTLDDDAGAIRLDTAGGSSLELSAERVRLHAAVDLEIAAPGRALVLRARTVDFRQAGEPES